MSDEWLAKALAAISRKDRTEAEMREWLVDREVESDEIERVIGYLTENLALDDRRFAFAYASDKRELSGWGKDRIREVLLQRGVDRYLVEQALDQPGPGVGQAESEVERAVRVLNERGADLSDDRGRQRALGLLARRGYEAEEAYAAIRIASRAA
ncbi:MAG: regulatory protein RecX [Solirubrobacterales bacterium]|nr:regulatory protein RecX [Solirubrobacterales bacterium]MCB0859405.1 regulatory protein RecX [Solirubrobacterales bacterium]HRV59411.1 regulatory protein RecX [Solirubrobacterales bacterium]